MRQHQESFGSRGEGSFPLGLRIDRVFHVQGCLLGKFGFREGSELGFVISYGLSARGQSIFVIDALLKSLLQNSRHVSPYCRLPQ